jgi:hypothetical protein
MMALSAYTEVLFCVLEHFTRDFATGNDMRRTTLQIVDCVGGLETQAMVDDRIKISWLYRP